MRKLTPDYERGNVRLWQGDCRAVLHELPDESVHCCVTSPPYYGLRDYGVDGQLGLEPTPEEYVANMVAVFREVRRVLRKDGTLWLNLGDSYANDGKWGGHTGGKHAKAIHCSPIGRHKKHTGLKPKDLLGIPWRVAFALQADGWYLRQDIIWHKPNPMPESVQDRCTKSHEYLFMLTKSARYFYDAEAIAEKATNRPCGNTGPGKYADIELCRTKQRKHLIPAKTERNKRSVWTVSTRPFPEAHFATYPPELIEPCILAGCPEDGTVLDPFSGAGTTAIVCHKTHRRFVGVELSPDYLQIACRRIDAAFDAEPLFAEPTETQSELFTEAQ